ncbi:MAG: lamin tail domain-containing protein [Candidatus Cloacimonetes bacterium]|nr:lamin tail domain-containing protein [Candidatus Cloacimonadota bacterium]
MKKTTIILAVIMTVFWIGGLWGQTTINFDDADNWTAGSAQIGSYASDHTYIDGSFSATGGPALRNGTTAQDGFPGALGTYSWRLRDNNSVDWRITISSGGVSTFSIDIRRWDNSPSPDFNLEYSLDSGSNWTLVTVINNTNLNDSSNWKTFNGTINSSNDNILIRLKANGTTERIFVDNFIWTGYSSSDPTITVTPTTLSGFTYIEGFGPSTSQSFSVSGTNLEADITVTPSSNYEISSNNADFQSTPITLAQSSGNVDATLYTRLKAGLTAGDYNNEDISCTSTNADDKTINCSGTVTALQTLVAGFSADQTTIYVGQTVNFTDLTAGGVPPYLYEWDFDGDGTGDSYVQNPSFTYNTAGTYTVSLNILDDNLGDDTEEKVDYITVLEMPEIPSVFFSEYIEGSSNNKAIEIYNGTGAAFSLNNLRIACGLNGANYSQYHSFPVDETLGAGNVWVIAHSSTNTDYFTEAQSNEWTSTTVVSFNGDDARALQWTNDGGLTWTTIDVIGRTDGDPGTNWSVAGTGATSEYTLVRKSTVSQGNTDWASSAGTNADDSEWIVYPQDTFDFLGEHPHYVGSTPDPGNNNQANVDVPNIDVDGTPVNPDVSITPASGQSTGNVNVVVRTNAANAGSLPNPENVALSYTITIANNQTAKIVLSYEGLPLAPDEVVHWNGSQYIEIIPINVDVVNETVSFTFAFNGRGTTEFLINNGVDSTLPVTLASFDHAVTAENFVSINWVTSTETNALGFNVYRSVEQSIPESSLNYGIIPATGASSQGAVYNYLDTEAKPETTYYYWLESLDNDFTSNFHGPITVYFDNEPGGDTPEVDVATRLYSAYPNPFNPDVRISYNLSNEDAASAEIRIYNLKGTLVKTFSGLEKGKGKFVYWNGKDESGRECSTGIYFYKMKTATFSKTSKMMLLK